MKKSKENILITRSLKDESPIWQLSKDGHQLIAQSFLDIIPLSITEIPIADVYFYYSKNAARLFVKAAQKLQLDLSKYNHAAMGEGTASVLENLEIKLNFIGKDTPKDTAQSLIDQYTGSTLCFVRAMQSTRSIQKLWPYEYSEVIAYSASPKSIQITKKINTILATSPMNLEAALQCCDVSDLKRIVCIGPTTYKAALRLSNVEIFMAKESNEVAMLASYFEVTL